MHPMQVRYLAALRPDFCRLAQRLTRYKVRMASWLASEMT